MILLLACAAEDSAKTGEDPDSATSTDDADGDGYSVADGDCDDADAAVSPAAAETCDGIDNDCDAAVDDVASAAWDDGSGPVDVTAELSGSFGAPALWTTPGAGSLSLCGLLYANLVATADLVVSGQGAGLTIVEGGEGPTVLSVATDGVRVEARDLSLRGGLGTEVEELGGRFGGGAFCRGSASLVLDEVEVSRNEADFAAGIAVLSGCSLEMSGGSVSGNTASSTMAGIGVMDATASLDGVSITDNYAFNGIGGIGGQYVFGSPATRVDLVGGELRGNTAPEGAGLYLLSAAGSCAGTVFAANADHGVTLFDGIFDAEACDFGADGGADDNGVGDVVTETEVYEYGDDASFSCAGGACG